MDDVPNLLEADLGIAAGGWDRSASWRIVAERCRVQNEVESARGDASTGRGGAVGFSTIREMPCERPRPAEITPMPIAAISLFSTSSAPASPC